MKARLKHQVISGVMEQTSQPESTSWDDIVSQLQCDLSLGDSSDSSDSDEETPRKKIKKSANVAPDIFY